MSRIRSTSIVRVHGAAELPEVQWPGKGAPTLRAFAKANGLLAYRGRWPTRFGDLQFNPDVLRQVDHCELLSKPGTRRVVAIVSHDYHPNADFSALGPSIIVERLPQSWYSPQTTAYLLRPTSLDAEALD